MCLELGVTSVGWQSCNSATLLPGAGAAVLEHGAGLSCTLGDSLPPAPAGLWVVGEGASWDLWLRG